MSLYVIVEPTTPDDDTVYEVVATGVMPVASHCSRSTSYVPTVTGWLFVSCVTFDQFRTMLQAFVEELQELVTVLMLTFGGTPGVAVRDGSPLTPLLAAAGLIAPIAVAVLFVVFSAAAAEHHSTACTR